MLIAFGLVLSVYTILRSPSFQKLAARLAADYLSEKLGTEVRIAGLRVSNFFDIQVDGLYLADDHRNPVIDIDKLIIGIREFRPGNGSYDLSRVYIQNGSVSLVTYENDSLLNLVRVLRPLLGNGRQDTVPPPAWDIHCGKLVISSLDFTLKNENKLKPGPGMDFGDIEVKDISMEMKDLSKDADTLTASVISLNCSEQSGINLREFSGQAKVSPETISVRGLHLVMNETELNLDLAFMYEGYKDISSFLDSVRIEADIRSSYIKMKNIGYFAPVLFQMDNGIQLSAKVSGPVADLHINDLDLAFGDLTRFTGNVSMKGLPVIQNTVFDVDIEDADITAFDLENFALPVEDKYLTVPPMVHNLGLVTVSGKFTGTFKDFKTKLSANTSIGIVKADAEMHQENKSRIPYYAGDITLEEFDLGNFLSYPDLSTLSLDFELEGKGITKNTFSVNMTGWVKDLVFKGHTYSQVILGGKMDAHSFNGRFGITDEALTMSFEGLADFQKESPRFDFMAQVDRALLYDMNLSNRSEDMDLSFVMDVDFTGLDPDNFRGNIDITKLDYTEEGVEYELSDFHLTRVVIPGTPSSLSLRSDYVDAEIHGDYSVTSLWPQMRSLLLGNLFPGYRDSSETLQAQNLTFDIHLKDVSTLTDLFVPKMSISPGTDLSGDFNSFNKTFHVQGALSQFKYAGFSLDNIAFDGSVIGDFTNLDLQSSQLSQDSDETGPDSSRIGIENLRLTAEMIHDSLAYDLSWNDDDPRDLTKGFMEGYFLFLPGRRIESAVSDAASTVNGRPWRIQRGNHIIFDPQFISVKELIFSAPNQEFKINGTLSDMPSDTMLLSFDNWLLSNFNPLIASGNVSLKGLVNGYIGISQPRQTINFFTNLQLKDLVFNGADFGDGYIKTRWINQDKWLKIDAELFNISEGEKFKTLDVEGKFMPFEIKQNFSLDIRASNLRLLALQPFLKSFSSKLDGFVSGPLSLSGTTKKPILTGKVRVQRAEMHFDYLNVTYSFSNDVVFTEDAITFENMEVYDVNSNKAVLSGKISHRYFKDMSLDLDIKPEKFLALDLNRYQNELFYGKAYASGNIRIYGPFDDITIDVDARAEDGTSLYIPINYSVDVSQSDFIIFVNESDTSQQKPKYKVYVKGLNLNISIDVSPQADVQIFLPSDMGYIKSRGAGRIRFGLDPRGYLSIFGTYTIYDGLFLFSFEQLLSKRFTIEYGSNIAWSGNLYDAEVNIKARYRTKTSLAGLGAGLFDPSSASRKVNVQCIIYMTGQLFNPNLRFNFNFPNLDDATRQIVYSALDTTDAAVMNQQAISLLVLNTFSSATATNPITSAAIISNSLSSILSNISNDFDIGINYIPGDAVSSDEIELAMSTQLFNDRLTIDGAFDVTNNQNNTQKTSSLVGDVTLEYKLTRDGRFRIKAYNRSNDMSFMNDGAEYTQGVGVFYRKEFNNLRDFFSKQKKAKLVEQENDQQEN